ncbi:amino acid adenylation domain-containing protein [Aurantibacter sp.]|uniref:amino acid adenylation domain-containing protein n=1 Tax=Aurantibacter sp. TaxID=2807103 RepID=UPI003263CBBF
MTTTLPQILRSAANKLPNQESFRFGSDSLNYKELDVKTDKLASHLNAKGVKKGDRIGVYMFRSLETAIAMYGIMKTGAAFVPLDPGLPISRINYLLNDCGIEHVITNPNLHRKHRKILEHKSPLKSFIGVRLNTDFETISWDDIFNITLENFIEIPINENDLAYIMYTSGSTGFPKGIMHTHKSGLSYARLSVNLFKINEDDRLASHAPLHFDISTLGYLAGPLAMATTIIISEAHTKMAPSLAALIEQEKITIWYSVPLALVQLLQSNSIQKMNLSALRLFLFGGEVFANKFLNELMHLCPEAKFYNVYGPAEVNQCTCYHIKKPPLKKDVIPIGQVWEETEFIILDKQGRKINNNDYGELAIHSSTMMKGYWNNQTLTNKSTYVAIQGELEKKFFKTGDMVKMNETGDFHFKGRNDRQVKIRGYRIEIDEIEAALLTHEKIIEAAVIVLQKNESEKEVMAAVIVDQSCTIGSKELLEHCRGSLPSYAVPQSIEIMPDFPRTGSGKIDRKEIIKTYIKI